MGIFWDLIQQEELAKKQRQADTIEDRVELLEKELQHTRNLLYKTLQVLEEHVGKDIDGDGVAG